MIQRCYNPKHQRYKDYGAVGIKVCPQWMKFEGFLKDMGEPALGCVLDRKDNALGYSPENCHWTTFKQSTENRRNTVWLDYQGKRWRVHDLAAHLGIPFSRIWNRLRYGWTVDEIAKFKKVRPGYSRFGVLNPSAAAKACLPPS